MRTTRLAVTVLAMLTFCGLASARNHDSSDRVVVVSAAELPEPARIAGQAMFLHDTLDGRTLLYIEQNHGARLAIFDVTDPAHIRAEGSPRLDAPGSFDFVAELGPAAVLIRFRNNGGEAVLDLRKTKSPALSMVQGLYPQGQAELLSDDVMMVAKRPSERSDADDTDYQVVDVSNPFRPNQLTDIKHVLETITQYQTGTTYLITADGLYLIRRPAAEEEARRREQMTRHTP